ncbi:MAG: dTDP-4-dehydrorhamnose reductase [Anaerolineales bacterium]|nr:dTDP-4-dehydrorhamnose reductase [Anaerolineales bacterium]
MMQILLLGKNGQLGGEFARILPQFGTLTAVDYPEIDFTKPDALRQFVGEVQPGLIVNAAAYTLVDKAEEQPEIAEAINATAVRALAEESARLNAVLVHYSTDFVYDGTKPTIYVEDDAANPLSVYGKTKLAGDQAIMAAGGAYFIFRTSWVYSVGGDQSFVTKVLKWARHHKTLRIVDDQTGSPTWSKALANLTAQVIAKGGDTCYNFAQDHGGLYHLSGKGAVNRYEWARAILALDPGKAEQIVEEIVPASSAEFPAPARRPVHSPLSCERFEKTFGIEVPPWRAMLEKAMAGK